MKAIRAARSYAPGGPALALLLLCSCVAPVQPPPAPPARALPATPPPPEPIDWHDMPATPGGWQWSRDGGLSVARFIDLQSQLLFTMGCNTAGGITLANAGAGTADVLTIQTTTLSRRLALNRAVAVLGAYDPLLDAMAFSRGRFAVDVPGGPSLYLPSQPEVARVIDDCRSATPLGRTVDNDGK